MPHTLTHMCAYLCNLCTQHEAQLLHIFQTKTLTTVQRPLPFHIYTYQEKLCQFRTFIYPWTSDPRHKERRRLSWTIIAEYAWPSMDEDVCSLSFSLFPVIQLPLLSFCHLFLQMSSDVFNIIMLAIVTFIINIIIMIAMIIRVGIIITVIFSISISQLH